MSRRERPCVRGPRVFPPPLRVPGVHEIARRVSVTAGSRGARAAWVPPSKNADGPLPHPTPLPTLRFACTGHRRAQGLAVVLSQASATVSIAESSTDTFPAVHALQPAAASTCRASFPGACLTDEPEGAPLRPRITGVSST